MKRSQVNSAILWAMGLIDRHCFRLPPFGYWKLEDWRKNRSNTAMIQYLMLGWDVTDFGMGDYEKVGSVLFTLRNGNQDYPSMGTPYAEKIILIMDGQRLPLHFHFTKTEDIINRGGGTIFIQLYNACPDDSVDYDTDVSAYIDAIKHTVKAGKVLNIAAGSSITLTPRTYHLFGAKKGSGEVLTGEVSSVNDDNIDNHFAEPVSRFSYIEEDEPALYPLCNEYKSILAQR